MEVLGIDACGKQGWVGIRLAEGAYAGCLVDVRLAALIERAGHVLAIAVDMPLGLVEEGWRAADRAAKALLGERRSSVFSGGTEDGVGRAGLQGGIGPLRAADGEPTEPAGVGVGAEADRGPPLLAGRP